MIDIKTYIEHDKGLDCINGCVMVKGVYVATAAIPINQYVNRKQEIERATRYLLYYLNSKAVEYVCLINQD